MQVGSAEASRPELDQNLGAFNFGFGDILDLDVSGSTVNGSLQKTTLQKNFAKTKLLTLPNPSNFGAEKT
jgi:hypothetical protein